jgi:hypothetical protein
VRAPDQGGDPVDRDATFVVRLPHLLFGPLPVFDVGTGPVPLDDLAVLVA